MSLQVGQQLGSYEITALLGKGGMGEVYRARDLKLKREVAIKILPEEFSRACKPSSESARRTFARFIVFSCRPSRCCCLTSPWFNSEVGRAEGAPNDPAVACSVEDPTLTLLWSTPAAIGSSIQLPQICRLGAAMFDEEFQLIPPSVLLNKIEPAAA